ncbi:MAG: aldehyde dehydrogenase [Rhodospirillaceae bacterium]|nr:aldehyde dehydrogenase [Rhodospirillaceae bacterium]
MPQPILIGGEWKPGRGPVVVSHYPHDQSVSGEVTGAAPADVDDAVRAGKAALADPKWRDLLPHQRALFLYKIADLITARAEELAHLQRRDNGKPISETRALVASAAGTFRYFGAVCETAENELTPSRGPFLSMSTWDPCGVVAAITPWNSPIASDAQKLAPALAAGNAVILKPAGPTPLVALELGRLCLEAGLPKGVVSVLPGAGRSVGNAIVAHPDVKMVSFTGGTATGKSIAHVAADKMMPVILELGGKSPTIVCDDAEIDHAVNGVIFGIFSSAGQSCIAGSRLFVAERIYDDFMARLVAKTKTLRVADPELPTTQMGPQITPEHRASIESYIELGRKEGGTVLCGGERPSGAAYAKGNYLLPTILEGLGNQARICQEEIFGPVLVALKYKDEEDLLAQANDSVFGLASGIWTRDYRRAWRIGRRLEAGTVWVNTFKQFSISTPFAGRKDSGIGVEKGRLGIRNYMRQKSFYWGLNEGPIPWAD